MAIDATIQSLLTTIYGTVPPTLADGLTELLLTGENATSSATAELWSEKDVVLITYADQVRDAGKSPLSALRSFLIDHELNELIRCVHLLPFCPYTSDDGFSVVDYLAVDPDSGSWEDIAALGERFDLMFDLVLNHCSQKHDWFQRFLSGDAGYENYFIDQDPSADLSAVVRPRSWPLLTEFPSADGTKHIWTTFSADQVDLNYENPRVMLDMIRTLVEYAKRGARIIRLDAIAFLWKEVGTDCIHRPQTHAAVQLMRYILDRAVPGTLVLTETNVPHKENIAYFGDGTNEAHMVYQFSLPPLLLDAIHQGDTSIVRDWLKDLKPPSDETTFFNFTASHDGVGVRPLESIIPTERVGQLVDAVQNHGGRVSMRSQSDGTKTPYELNITYVDAVADRTKVSPEEHCKRFLATQAIMLSIQGMPAVYFHSLVGSPNDQEVFEKNPDLENRQINRHKYDRDELESALQGPDELQRRIFEGYQNLIRIRTSQRAFHPAATMEVLDLPGDGQLGWIRRFEDQNMVVLANLSTEPKHIDAEMIPAELSHDHLSGESINPDQKILLSPFQVRWIS